ncbi:MAG: RNase II-type exonuclease C-terminal domain, partial [Aeromicrobium sp.]|nr:RNase II-type exonuclease C-terminal domain [Aeromicrobium sp.]
DRGPEVIVIKPPVIARCKGAGLQEGAQVAVRLDSIDVISFSYVAAG